MRARPFVSSPDAESPSGSAQIEVERLPRPNQLAGRSLLAQMVQTHRYQEPDVLVV